MNRKARFIGFFLGLIAVLGVQAHALDAHVHDLDKKAPTCSVCHAPSPQPESPQKISISFTWSTAPLETVSFVKSTDLTSNRSSRAPPVTA